MKSKIRTTHKAITTLFLGWLAILGSYILIHIRKEYLKEVEKIVKEDVK